MSAFVAPNSANRNAVASSGFTQSARSVELVAGQRLHQQSCGQRVVHGGEQWGTRQAQSFGSVATTKRRVPIGQVNYISTYMTSTSMNVVRSTTPGGVTSPASLGAARFLLADGSEVEFLWPALGEQQLTELRSGSRRFCLVAGDPSMLCMTPTNHRRCDPDLPVPA